MYAEAPTCRAKPQSLMHWGGAGDRGKWEIELLVCESHHPKGGCFLPIYFYIAWLEQALRNSDGKGALLRERDGAWEVGKNSTGISKRS